MRYQDTGYDMLKENRRAIETMRPTPPWKDKKRWRILQEGECYRSEAPNDYVVVYGGGTKEDLESLRIPVFPVVCEAREEYIRVKPTYWGYKIHIKHLHKLGFSPRKIHAIRLLNELGILSHLYWADNEVSYPKKGGYKK